MDGESPSIDFAGAGRAVPWATWYENTTGTGFGANNIFASRFDVGEREVGFRRAELGVTAAVGPDVPSLNIHTDQSAENPSVAGGSAVDPTKPGPWVTWQETTSAPVAGKDQIFVSKPIGPGTTDCAGVTPAGVQDTPGHVPAIGGFCFQQAGLGRVGPGGVDPSLNVDVTRNGVEPDIAFTGPNDSVPWVVWYEKDRSAAGLAGNEMVFAAKGEPDTSAGVVGGFHWHVVGNTGNGILNAANTCAGSLSAEQACSLNSDPAKDAEDPRVAAGTMNPANPTAPWVTWDETVGGVHQVFVSRFVATPTPHFQIVNGGNPISTAGVESTRPDITFSGNTPYVTWREQTNTGTKAFVGHLVNAANPTFVLDESDVALTPTAQADVREPISSACTANPFNNDGQACQGAAVGTPFLLFTNGTDPRSLFADAYQPGTPVTGAASVVTNSSATVDGSVNPLGASVNVHFDFGTTTAYGQSTAAQKAGPDNAVDRFSAQLGGLPAGTTIHYRVVAVSDFGTFVGADQTFRTQPAAGRTSVGTATVSGTAASVPVSCAGQAGATCQLELVLAVTDRLHGHRLIAVNARRSVRADHEPRVIGRTDVTLTAGQSQTVQVALNHAGRELLEDRHHLHATLLVFQVLPDGHVVTVSSQAVTFTRHMHHAHHNH